MNVAETSISTTVSLIHLYLHVTYQFNFSVSPVNNIDSKILHLESRLCDIGHISAYTVKKTPRIGASFG